MKDTAKIEKQAESIARLGVRFDKVRLFPEQRRPSRDSGGSPLPGLLRRKMELAFAADLSEVRVHQGPDAQALSALAFTQGREVHFAPGQYNPSSAEGQKIIGHELAHVVQQQSGKVARPQGGGVPINDDASLEAEADRQAQQAVGSSGFVGIRRENPSDTASAKGCPGLSCWDSSEPAAQPVLSESPANLPIQKCSSCGEDSCASGEKCGITGHSLELESGIEPTSTEDIPEYQPIAGKTERRTREQARSSDGLVSRLFSTGYDSPDQPQPSIGLSHRPGFGYDESRLSSLPRDIKPQVESLPPLPRGVNVPGQRPKSNVRAQERWDLENAAYEGAIRKQRRDVMSGSLLPDEVRGEIEGSYEEGEGRDKAIKRAVAKQSLSSVHGLYIPGDFNANPTQVASADSTTKVADQRLNQPRDAKSREERATRDEYEQLLIREARNRGMPTMAICGGSWRLLEAFGGQVETIPGDPHQRRDNRHGHLGRLNDQAHGVGLEPNSFIGGISPVVESETGKTPKHSIDSVNSTHWAVASADTSGKLVSRFRDEENPDLEGMPKNPDEELQVTGWGPGWKDNHRVPEAFETRHGAPMMGIQWHPEAYITGAGRTEATPEARESSDRLFKGFNQAMRAYAGRQQVNEELLKRFSKLS